MIHKTAIALAWMLGVSGATGLAGAADGPFHFVSGAGFLDLYKGDVPVYRQMIAYDTAKQEETKKVFHHVYGFHGEGYITKGAGGLWGHHRGIWVGWSDVTSGGKTQNFWECPDGNSQRHEKFNVDRDIEAPNMARKSSVTAWVDATGKTWVKDVREVTSWFPSDGVLALDFSVTLQSPNGDSITMQATPHHGGLQFRGITDSLLPEDFIMPADSKAEQADVWAPTNGNVWVFEKYAVAKHNYGILLMDHPSNPRIAKTSRRDYGRIGSYYAEGMSGSRQPKMFTRFLIIDLDKNTGMNQAKLQAYYDAYSKSAPGATLPSATTGVAIAGGGNIRLMEGRNRASIRFNGAGMPVVYPGAIHGAAANVFGLNGRGISLDKTSR
jgi:hypothetical protein